MGFEEYSRHWVYRFIQYTGTFPLDWNFTISYEFLILGVFHILISTYCCFQSRADSIDYQQTFFITFILGAICNVGGLFKNIFVLVYLILARDRLAYIQEYLQYILSVLSRETCSSKKKTTNSVMFLGVLLSYFITLLVSFLGFLHGIPSATYLYRIILFHSNTLHQVGFAGYILSSADLFDAVWDQLLENMNSSKIIKHYGKCIDVLEEFIHINRLDILLSCLSVFLNLICALLNFSLFFPYTSHKTTQHFRILRTVPWIVCYEVTLLFPLFSLNHTINQVNLTHSFIFVYVTSL